VAAGRVAALSKRHPQGVAAEIRHSSAVVTLVGGDGLSGEVPAVGPLQERFRGDALMIRFGFRRKIKKKKRKKKKKKAHSLDGARGKFSKL